MGVTQQALLAIMTSSLLLLSVHHHQERWQIGDERSLRRQEDLILCFTKCVFSRQSNRNADSRVFNTCSE